MSGFLTGRRAIVTGGTRGIGRAITEALLDDGASVAICGRTASAVDAAVAEMRERGNVVGRATDVADLQAVSSFFQFTDEAFGGLDILVNNAGIGIFRPVGELAQDEWRRVLSINLDAVYYCCREALPRMKTSGGGSIVNISSLAGRNPFAGGAAYNASKFGLNGFSEALMLDHRNDGIRVTYVMPGSVDTDFSPRSERASWKIAPQDVSDVVMSVLRMPARTTVSRVEIRPSIPPRT
ncbi:MAG: SDR family oxidoreductase [Bryobacteraceae bacterium]|nr:SDR family oxidoreductase [Bryobacteraceae bacterium]